MASIDERIAALETKLKQEKAKKQQIEARKRSVEAKKKRSDDTRRKVLIGAAVLAQVEQGRWPHENMLAMMNKALTRADDRALFDLPPRQSTSGVAASQEPSSSAGG